MACGAVFSVLVILLATVLLVLGMFLDDWIDIDGNTEGPFRSCVNGNCIIRIPPNVYLQASSWLLVCSLVGNGLSLILSAVCLFMRKSRRRILLNCMMVLSAIAGVSSFAGLLVWMGRFASLDLPVSYYGPGWALLPFSIILSFLHVAVCAMLRKELKQKPVKRYETNGTLGKQNGTAGLGVASIEMTRGPENTTTSQDSTNREDRQLSGIEEENAIDFTPEYEQEQNTANDIRDSNTLETKRHAYYKEVTDEDQWSYFTPDGVIGNTTPHTDVTMDNSEQTPVQNEQSELQEHDDFTIPEQGPPQNIERDNSVNEVTEGGYKPAEDQSAEQQQEHGAQYGAADEQTAGSIPVAPPPPPIM